MLTAKSIIDDAYDDLEIKSNETDLTAGEYLSAIRRLNRLAFIFAAQGIDLGWTELAAKEDEVTIPDYAEELFVTFLAIRLAPSFGVQLNPALLAAANMAMQVVELNHIKIYPAAFPNTLPTGSGNSAVTNRPFFTDTEESVIASITGIVISE